MNDRANAPRVSFATQIEMAHGAAARPRAVWSRGSSFPLLANPVLETLSDAALLTSTGQRLAMTTDGFVVKPLVFPAVRSASLRSTERSTTSPFRARGRWRSWRRSSSRPVLPVKTLEAEIAAMAHAARAVRRERRRRRHKVVEHGKADGMYVDVRLGGESGATRRCGLRAVRAGDRVLLSGPIGDHGITILLARGELDLEAELASDTRSVAPFVDALARAAGDALRWMRDPTRGGVATALNEAGARLPGWASRSTRKQIPLRDEVRGACEILGLDPLHIANEGQFLAVVAPEQRRCRTRCAAPYRAAKARLIGEMRRNRPEPSSCDAYGGTRVVDMLVGDPLPRIC